MGILRTIISRVLYAAALLFAVLVLNFSLMHLAPGDVADTISQSMGGADQEILDEIRVSYGLDQPFIVQLGKYIANVAQFDLGYSFFYNQPVSRLILERLPADQAGANNFFYVVRECAFQRIAGKQPSTSQMHRDCNHKTRFHHNQIRPRPMVIRSFA